MKIQNNTQTTFVHGDIRLLPNGAITEIKDKKIAQIWLKINGIHEYIAPEDVEAQLKDLKEENAKLKAEIEKLKEKNKKEDKKAK